MKSARYMFVRSTKVHVSNAKHISTLTITKIYKSGNSLEKKVMTVKPITSQSGIFGCETFSSRVSLCAITMDNLHHLTGCLGQYSL